MSELHKATTNGSSAREVAESVGDAGVHRDMALGKLAYDDRVELEAARKPFSLRGHHVMTLTPLMTRKRVTPGFMASEQVKYAKEYLGGLTAETVDFSLLTEQAGQSYHTREDYEAIYAYDLTGGTSKSAESYRANFQAALEAFIDLDDDARVELIADGKDGICNACTFQKHCEIEKKDEDNEDFIMLSIVEDVARHYSPIDDRLGNVERSSNGRSVITNAGTIRRVMQYFGLDGSNGGCSLYADAMIRYKEHGSVFGGPTKSDLELCHTAFYKDLEC